MLRLLAKISRVLAIGGLYFCVASMLALGFGIGSLAWKGYFSKDKLFRAMALLQNVDLVEMEAEKIAQAKVDATVQIAYEQVLKQRTRKALDLDLREGALDKALAELQNIRNSLVEQKDRYELVRDSFEGRLEKLQEGASDRTLLELQRTLEALPPRQAKDHIKRFLEEGQQNDVVTILMAMPVDKRKKIISEFKDEGEPEILFDVFQAILEGKGEGELIQQTREQIKDLNPG